LQTLYAGYKKPLQAHVQARKRAPRAILEIHVEVSISMTTRGKARRAARGNYAASAVAEIAIDRIVLFSWFIHQTRGSPVIAVAVPCPYSIP